MGTIWKRRERDDRTDDAGAADARLVEGLRRGHPDAFAGLHEQYAGGIYNLALRVVRHGPDAEDITQDVSTLENRATKSNEKALEKARANIRDRGAQVLRMLDALKDELGGRITEGQGTGLLFSCELAPGYKGYGTGSTEEWMREQGIGVIHGGENSLRFTPHFAVTGEEMQLVVSMVKRALLEGPRVAQAAAA